MNIQSENTEEIICSNCGRPNLPEAVKCWYCQIQLNQGGETDAEQVEFTESQAEAHQPIKGNEPEQAQEEQIPEWLKRIRENEQKEREVQDAQNQWQQQALFGGPNTAQPEEAPRPKKEVRHPVKVEQEIPAPQTEKTSPQPQPENKKPIQPQKEKSAIIEEDDFPSEEPSEDLPEGFIKFNSKSN